MARARWSGARITYDGQQVALLDATGALLWRSGVQDNCWPPRPFFNAPVTDHLDGLKSLDSVAPLAHGLLAEAHAQWQATAHDGCCQQTAALAPRGLRAGDGSTEFAQPARTRVARRVLHANLSRSHIGPYGFLSAQRQTVVNAAQAAMVQRLTARYGVAMAQSDNGPAWTWAVPGPISSAAAGACAGQAQQLTLHQHAGCGDGDGDGDGDGGAWWELWLSASPPAGPPPLVACAVQGAPGGIGAQEPARHRLTRGAHPVKYAVLVARTPSGKRAWPPAVTVLIRLFRGLAALAGSRAPRKRLRTTKLRNPGSRTSV
jgi:hypothetical protein